MEFFDTHCHIHFPDYGCDPDEARKNATEKGVSRLICVGCTLEDSESAVEYAKKRDNVWASVGFHPHEADKYIDEPASFKALDQLAQAEKVVAVGEIGLDYYYENSSRKNQQKILCKQLDIATKNNLPVIFHVRDAFSDFWPIFDSYSNIRGVIHSFTATIKELEEALKRDLYTGLNGIITFTKDQAQLDAAKTIPLNRLILETDAPFLTPIPFRGKMCQPGHIVLTAEFLSNLRNESLEDLAAATTANARALFGV